MSRAAAGLIAICCAAALAARAQAPAADARGAIDFHAHAGPDAIPRLLNDLELARLAKREGWRGLVLKNHFVMTADRAALVMEEVKGIEVFGGIVLNRAVGGLNAEAVRAMATWQGSRGKVVWLPTRDAENDRARATENRPAVAVVRDGKPVPELIEIFRLIAEHDLVLETGHSSASESLILIAAAKQAGVRAIVVTHVFSGRPTEAQMAQMAGAGATMECIYGDDRAIAACAQAIKALGSEHFVLASDLGRLNAPLPTDGLRLLLEKLQAQGIAPAQIDIMVRKNPARLLGLPLS